MVLLTFMKIFLTGAVLLLILLIFDIIMAFICSLFPKLQYRLETLSSFMRLDVYALIVCVIMVLMLDFFRKGVFLWF